MLPEKKNSKILFFHFATWNLLMKVIRCSFKISEDQFDVQAWKLSLLSKRVIEILLPLLSVLKWNVLRRHPWRNGAKWLSVIWKLLLSSQLFLYSLLQLALGTSHHVHETSMESSSGIRTTYMFPQLQMQFSFRLTIFWVRIYFTTANKNSSWISFFGLTKN